jgi:ribA/ribD-fused uncharacterized protein
MGIPEFIAKAGPRLSQFHYEESGVGAGEGPGNGGDVKTPWSVLSWVSAQFLWMLECFFREYLAGNEVARGKDRTPDSVFVASINVFLSCEGVQKFDQFVVCVLFVTLVGGCRAFSVWQPNSILAEGFKTLCKWSFLGVVAMSASGYFVPLLCIVSGLAGHKQTIISLLFAWAVLERFPYKRVWMNVAPLVAARTRVVAFHSMKAGVRVIRGNFQCKREAHSTIVDATWGDLAKEPMLKGHVKVCVRMPDGSSYVHSAMQVGENCALCCAHAVKDPSISIQMAHEAGGEIFLVPYGDPIDTKTKCRTMPSHVMEGLKDRHNIWTLWRDERDNATVRDFAVIYFKDAGSRFEGAVTKHAFRHTYQPDAKVATYRAGAAGKWLPKWAGTNLAPITNEPGLLSSTLGSDPGMSGSPVFTVGAGGGKGRLVGINLGQDPQEGGLILSAATIRHHLLKKGFLTPNGKSFRWNDNWETTSFSYRPKATHEDQAGAAISATEGFLESMSVLERVAHASRSWRQLNSSERRDSEEQYGDERYLEIWDGDEEYEQEQYESRRFGVGVQDAGVEDHLMVDRHAENDMMDAEYNDLVHGTEGGSSVEQLKKHGGTLMVASDRVKKGNRKPHGAELTAAILAAKSKSLPFDIRESVEGLPLSERPSSTFNSKRGHAHVHACAGCGMEYEHTHVMVPVKFPEIKDCLNRPVLPFYGHSAGKTFREFSNFYEHSKPWVFTLPEDLGERMLPQVTCRWSEQAIMACKAAMFGDKQAFASVLCADSAETVKAIGRTVRGFEQGAWSARVRDIAAEVVLQKFKMDGSITHVLMETGEKVIVEAAPTDSIWGVGLSVTDERVLQPDQWAGENILGLALMWARDTIKFQGKPHKQWKGQCPNKACDCHDPVGVEKTLSKPVSGRVAHSPPGLSLKAMEGQSVQNAIAEANRQANKKYGRVTESILNYQDHDQEAIADRILSGKKATARREAHSGPFPKVTPTVKRFTDFGKCAICHKASEAGDGACDRCKEALTVVQGSVHVSDTKKEAVTAAASVEIIRSIVSEYPCLKKRVDLGKLRAVPHEEIEETRDSHGKAMYYTGFRTRHTNEPRTHKEKELDPSTIELWDQLAETARVDKSAYAMPPDTLDALMDSLFANCEKRVQPQIATSDPDFWRALAEYVTHHVTSPAMPDAADILRCDEIDEDELKVLTEPEWAEALRGFKDGDGMKELEEFFIHRVEKAIGTLHSGKSCGWDRLLYHTTTKGELRDNPDAMREVAECAVARLMVFARCGSLFRYLRPEHYVELGLNDPSMPVLKNEATPARKLKGEHKRWRSIMVGSACDELVEKVLQKGHSSRLQALFNLGADTASQIGTGSDDRHVSMLKHRVSAACESAGTENVVSTDVSGMDFCMSWPGCTTSLVQRVACLEASPGPSRIKVALRCALIACEFSCAQQGLLYGNTVILPTDPSVNKSGKGATSMNNTGPRSMVSIYCGALSASANGDDCVDVFHEGEDGLSLLAAGAARLGYTIRDAEQGSPDNFESCSKRYKGDITSPEYSFLNLEKAIARAVLCREFNAERANGLLYECRHDDALSDVVHEFFLRGVELGLWEDSPLAPVENAHGDMP